ncbi:DUF502 domain-containing protein [Arenibaculum pallidiluteum]|uniref:DUF502 domain-containing protein n=1 Tax=Arenibaculum pallidiluteum TaxID=2812559 RepID=UPI001A956390|nr:DUF502 domain-containing protein [Arenibaculum pallidiluteum]
MTDSQAPEHDAHPDGRPSLGLTGRIRAYFLAGVLVTAPISITLYLAWLLVVTVDGAVTPLIPERYDPRAFLPFGLPGLGLVLAVVGLTLIGMFTAGYLGRLILRGGEALVARMPVIRSFYGATKQIFETVLANQSTAFREVVLIEYPRRGTWTLAFVTGVPQGNVQKAGGGDLVSVFVPTTPNPTSGFLLFLPRAEVHALAMGVEDGLKLVVSGGLVTPPEKPAATVAAPAPVDA